MWEEVKELRKVPKSHIVAKGLKKSVVQSQVPVMWVVVDTAKSKNHTIYKQSPK